MLFGRCFMFYENTRQKNVVICAECLGASTLWVKKYKTPPTHVDNFAKNWSIFKILSLTDSEHNFPQNKYCIAHHTLQMLLHYLVKLQCFKNRINSKIQCIFADVPVTCLISFFLQIRVSIKNYEMSVRVKYSVRDLIMTSISVHEPQ